MPTEVIRDNINAAARIIGDISTGIYRSPANAMKELVSNAFDAGAEEVFIHTDQPSFASVSCYDNGVGIDVDQLREVFRFIGGSDKRSETEATVYGRPLIGKIGIGILAMSQISKQFVIISSKEGQPYRIETEVDIEEFESDDAARTNLGTGKIGTYTIYRIPESSELHYTIVTTPSGSEMLRRELRPGTAIRDYFLRKRVKADTFRELVSEIAQGQSPDIMSGYQSFLWELASLCPVPYFEDGPVKGWSDWDDVKKRLERYNFSVVADGYELRKPILLPTASDLVKQGEDYEIYPFGYDSGEDPNDLEDERRLKFRGYIYHQRKQLMPAELQGLLVRIRNVGIGGYDPSLLKYPRAIGPMVRGMTGEVYVDKGLEGALNIDRNSFNETHPHYDVLLQQVYGHLGMPGRLGIAADIRERSARRQERLYLGKFPAFMDTLVRRVGEAMDEEWSWEDDDSMEAPLLLDKGMIRINVNHDTVPSAFAARQQFFRVCLAARLHEVVGPPSGVKDGLVGWLRKL